MTSSRSQGQPLDKSAFWRTPAVGCRQQAPPRYGRTDKRSRIFWLFLHPTMHCFQYRKRTPYQCNGNRREEYILRRGAPRTAPSEILLPHRGEGGGGFF